MSKRKYAFMDRVADTSSPLHPDTPRLYRGDLSNESEPWFRLFAAVLHRGCVDYASARMKIKDEKDRERFNASEVYHWLHEDRDFGPGSFAWLCQVLDMDPIKARSAVIANSRSIFLAERRGCNNKEAKIAECNDAFV